MNTTTLNFLTFTHETQSTITAQMYAFLKGDTSHNGSQRSNTLSSVLKDAENIYVDYADIPLRRSNLSAVEFLLYSAVMNLMSRK